MNPILSFLTFFFLSKYYVLLTHDLPCILFSVLFSLSLCLSLCRLSLSLSVVSLSPSLSLSLSLSLSPQVTISDTAQLLNFSAALLNTLFH